MTDLRVMSEQPDTYDIELRMQDGSFRRVRVPRGWVEHARGQYYANLDEADSHDPTELPTEIRADLSATFADELPTLVDPARGRRREALLARVVSWGRRHG